MRILILSKRHYTAKDLIRDKYGRVFEFSRSLASRGHQVFGVALDYRRSKAGLRSEIMREGGLRWESMGLFPNPVAGVWRYLKKIRRIVEELRPDIILSVSDVYHVLVGDWLAKKTGHMHVVDLYDNYESFSAARIPGVILLFRKAVARADGIVCVSHPLKNYVHEVYKRSSKPFVITNAVDKSRFFPRERWDCRRHVGLPEEGRLVGLGGAIGSARGVSAVFEAHLGLLARYPDVHLVLVGRVDKDTVIPESANIHYLGELEYEAMPLFYGALDVGLVVNRDSAFARYCFPQKFFEMLACATPIAVSGTGEVVELMVGCESALFQPGDAQDMARAIGRQLESPCIPDVEKPSWDEQGAKLSRYLEKCLERGQ